MSSNNDLSIQRKKLFNPESTETVNERRTFGGTPSGICELTNVRYQWAIALWDMMLANTWFPREVDMTNDAKEYAFLSNAEKRMYDLVLSQLIFMDSVQTNNLANNVNYLVTAPEINNLIVRQAFEEALHSSSYAVMVESISKNTKEIYDMWRIDQNLLEKNTFIAQQYESLAKEVDEQGIVLSWFANQLLEGIYFNSGFTAMYSLSRNGKMHGSAAMIKFIQRDENTHLLVFQNLINSTRKERPDLFTPELEKTMIEMMEEAVNIETAWGKHTTRDEILGFTPAIIEKEIQWLANDRLKKLKLPAIYDVSERPCKWVEQFSSFNDTRANFFEGTVSNYSKGALSFEDF